MLIQKFKICTPFTKCVIHINDKHDDNADNLDIVMPMYNLIEYSDNNLDTSESLWNFNPIQDGGGKKAPLPVFPL